MRRRHILALLATVITGAGCSGSGPSGTDETSRATDGGPTATADAPAASVVLRSAIRYVANDDAIRVDPPENDLFAFVRPATPDPTPTRLPPPSRYTLVLGAEEFVPRSTIPGFRLDTPGVGRAHTIAERGGWLVFDLPTVETTEGWLRWDGEHSPLPSDRLPWFGSVPAFTVRSVSVPDSVAPEGTIEVVVAVANDGGRAGTFLLGAQRGGLFETRDLTVAPGETDETRLYLDVFADAGGVESFWLVHAAGSEHFEVAVEE